MLLQLIKPLQIDVLQYLSIPELSRNRRVNSEIYKRIQHDRRVWEKITWSNFDFEQYLQNDFEHIPNDLFVAKVQLMVFHEKLITLEKFQNLKELRIVIPCIILPDLLFLQNLVKLELYLILEPFLSILESKTFTMVNLISLVLDNVDNRVMDVLKHSSEFVFPNLITLKLMYEEGNPFDYLFIPSSVRCLSFQTYLSRSGTLDTSSKIELYKLFAISKPLDFLCCNIRNYTNQIFIQYEFLSTEHLILHSSSDLKLLPEIMQKTQMSSVKILKLSNFRQYHYFQIVHVAKNFPNIATLQIATSSACMKKLQKYRKQRDKIKTLFTDLKSFRVYQEY